MHSPQAGRRHHVDENSARHEPAGEMGEEQNLEASVARFPELVIEWWLYERRRVCV